MEYGWEGEIYLSLYAIAQIERICKKETSVWIRSYWNSFDYYPYRAEPLFWINTSLLVARKYEEGYALVHKALSIPYPTDTLPIERWIYDYGLLLQLADFCYFLGKLTEAREALTKLLAFSLPTQTLRIVEENLRKLYV
jgi:tetratricopeptide (TPR) repeat protein